jgi:hypothetical protein
MVVDDTIVTVSITYTLHTESFLVNELFIFKLHVLCVLS